MAASNPKSDAGQKTPQKGGQQSETRENLRNLALIVGITLLLILAVILTAFFIAEVVNNGQPQNTSPAAINPPAPSPAPEPSSVPSADDSDNGSSADSLGSSVDEQTGSNQTADGSTSSAQTTAPLETPAAPETPAAVTTPSGNTAGESTSATDTSAASSYTFTAGSGDSVSWLARRAMYAYMGDRGLGLDAGQRLYFELTLTTMSNPTALNIGDVRTFSASLMDQIFTNAANLPAAERAAWNATATNIGYN